MEITKCKVGNKERNGDIGRKTIFLSCLKLPRMKNVKNYLEEYKEKWILKTSSWEDENRREGNGIKIYR